MRRLIAALAALLALAGTPVHADDYCSAGGILGCALVNPRFSGTVSLGTADAVCFGDAGVSRTAAGVLKPTNCAAGNGWFQQTPGRTTLAADYTNATAAFTNT